uniref:dAMP1 SANT/Myb-like domain-containing protein n=1 Tax=Chromera velia CCMP2878 TaxID=1169474 RepID=A0A0G4IBC9_9ALVE|eukprot:Cvel_12786.t1-p1 / transcript=Cvel_12786.t1 / gene=Cvel_12786 / organism=Chromera_velia_CCMP2878 / gene_product=hypothetical protein / transcript_product=hypothetical protein / location=Cvel_scaffold851:21995-28459(+) / protein_length=623 / sequence_SO=supercontig / SO=protein_coding / is_pseudo=false
MFNRDLAEVMGAQKKVETVRATDVQAPKAKAKEKAPAKSKLIPRELAGIAMNDRGMIVNELVIALQEKKQANEEERRALAKKKAKKWTFCRHQEFSSVGHPSLGDCLFHWEPVDRTEEERENQKKRRKKESKRVEVVTYTDEEYEECETLLPLHGFRWTRETTDFLFRLARETDLSWPVMFDRLLRVVEGDFPSKERPPAGPPSPVPANAHPSAPSSEAEENDSSRQKATKKLKTGAEEKEKGGKGKKGVKVKKEDVDMASRGVTPEGSPEISSAAAASSFNPPPPAPSERPVPTIEETKERFFALSRCVLKMRGQKENSRHPILTTGYSAYLDRCRRRLVALRSGFWTTESDEEKEKTLKDEEKKIKAELQELKESKEKRAKDLEADKQRRAAVAQCFIELDRVNPGRTEQEIRAGVHVAADALTMAPHESEFGLLVGGAPDPSAPQAKGGKGKKRATPGGDGRETERKKRVKSGRKSVGASGEEEETWLYGPFPAQTERINKTLSNLKLSENFARPTWENVGQFCKIRNEIAEMCNLATKCELGKALLQSAYPKGTELPKGLPTSIVPPTDKKLISAARGVVGSGVRSGKGFGGGGGALSGDESDDDNEGPKGKAGGKRKR